MDDVEKAIIDRFQQAGPSLIKLEQRKSANRAFHGMLLGPDCFITGLEVGHLQYATTAYFNDP